MGATQGYENLPAGELKSSAPRAGELELSASRERPRRTSELRRTEDVLKSLEGLGASSLLLWQLRHPEFMHAFLALKIALGVALVVVTHTVTDLRTYDLAESAHISQLTMKMIFTLVAFWLATCEVASWHFFQVLLAEKATVGMHSNACSPIRALIDARNRKPLDASSSHEAPSLAMIVMTIATIIVLDRQEGHNWSEALRFAFTEEPVLLFIVLLVQQFCHPYGAALQDIVETGTECLISNFRDSLQKEPHDFKQLTTQHRHLDKVLEHVWHDCYGWHVLVVLSLRACYAFAAGVLVLAAISPLVRAASAALVCMSLFLIGRLAFRHARYTELCIKRSAGEILGQLSIMRVAMNMYGELDDDERDAHANFMQYLRTVECGVELPVVGLLTFQVVGRYATQAVALVPTGLALCLAVLNEKS
eukprot:TRINITY_DN3793_c0_g1_i1.p1 TRINITY_DN3793_c0_g1~~TRINITY_DN3793_c0_g1_i1.p1  ORF type:complete len:421 (+),score=39.24 TRINITY_DN3793_c0_g1_i1:60-1322(+)